MGRVKGHTREHVGESEMSEAQKSKMYGGERHAGRDGWLTAAPPSRYMGLTGDVQTLLVRVALLLSDTSESDRQDVTQCSHYLDFSTHSKIPVH